MEKVMITGGSGYIGSWVVKDLLEKGYTVRMMVRDKSNQDKIKHLLDIERNSPGTLEVLEADLLQKGSFDEAAKGCKYIIHMASPFIMGAKDPQKELVDPALDGTRNVLQAASNSGSVEKVVLTSSVASIYGDNKDMKEMGISAFTEEHFNHTSTLKHQSYSYSKVLAEKEAWKIEKGQQKWQLIVINPAFVMGPPLGKETNSGSISLMNDFLSGKYHSGAPELIFSFVDVRDIAKAHVLAMESNDAEGRYIVSERETGLYEFSNIIKAEYGKKYKLPLMKAPKFILYLMAPLFGLTRKFVQRNVGYDLKLDNTKGKEQFKIDYIPLEKSVKDMVDQLEKNRSNSNVD